jgi:AcrR family transcriptional regulator
MEKGKRRAIMQAAAECLARFGYEKTTMEDVGRRVGLNKASLYYYFKSKEALFTAVVIDAARQFIDTLQVKVAAAGMARQQVETYLVERLHYFRRVVSLHNLSFETLRQVQPVFRELYRSVLAQEIVFLEKLLVEGMQRRELKPCDTARIAQSLLTLADALKHAACEDPASHWPADIDFGPIESDLRFLVQLIMDGLAAPHASPPLPQ